MTVSKHGPTAWFCTFVLRHPASHFVAVSLTRVGVGIHAFVWQGEARFVTSALLGPPLLQVCLQLPVTFKAQGFKSRGGGALRDFLRYWGLLSCRTFNSVDCCVCLTLPPLCLVVFLGDCVDYVGGVEQLGLRTLLFLHAAAGAAGAEALRGQRKGAPSLGGSRFLLRPCIFAFPFLFQYVGSN